MNSQRYEGYRATRTAIAALDLDGFAAEVLSDIAENLLLARDDAEAETARERVPKVLVMLVDEGSLTRRSADRFWAYMHACAPRTQWPSSWDRAPSGAPRYARSA